MRFSNLCTPTDSSDKTQSMCSAILLCLFTSKYDINGNNWTTVPCPATNLSILICKSSARTKRDYVALKTPLQIRLGISIYKTSLLHRPDDYVGFTPSCPPTLHNKIAPMVLIITAHTSSYLFFPLGNYTYKHRRTRWGESSPPGLKICRVLSVFSQAQVAQKSWMIKNISMQWKISGQLCFSGQAQVAQNSWMTKNIYSIQLIQDTLCFSGQAQVAQKSWTVKIFSIECIQCTFSWGWSV